MKKKFVAVFAFMLVAILSAQTAHKRPSVVIMPFDAKGGVAQEDCEVITEEFMSKYAVVGNSVVVNRNTLAQIQTEQMFQASDWSDSNKTTRLGEALNAQQIVSGQLRLYNGLIFVIVQVQDIRTLAVLASVNVRVKDVMELLDKVPDICKTISAQMNGEFVGFKQTEQVPKQTNYKIGDLGPGNGWIFYVSEEGFPIYKGSKMVVCHYLECAPTSLGGGTWCSMKREKECCNVNTTDGLGAGYSNTANIIAASHKGGSLPSYCAANQCKNYHTGTTKKGDWYLPSNLELDLIYKNLVRNGIIKSNEKHWSSTQDFSYMAWGQSFDNGKQFHAYKSSWMYIRAVRAF